VTIVDSEAAIIRELAERIIAGETLSALARDLTERGIPTVQAGTRWNARSVHSVVYALDPGPTPPAIQAEVAARAMGPGEDPVDVGRGVRRRWLAQVHRGDLR
jgi:Recombinase